ncbi:hypothetical protein EW146_g8040 [Bondarzewia mesenterica]|uniref:Uncharacterized protein n=1 Tax=Bondarzewia mesenterica TaxID=1095465 RepID=A0A4S4LHJ9_9AGAM|nr:hypothetical protein EW146_g8040 [Bondarzewia mesenterica]
MSPQATSSPPPILELINLLSHSFSVLWAAGTVVSQTLFTVTSYAFTPLALFLPVLLYVFAPVILFLQLLFDALIITPFNVLIYILQAVYPLYVFVGVACISGAVIGLGARQVVGVVGRGLLRRRPSEEFTTPRGRDDSRARAQRRSSMKGKKRAFVH